MNTINTTSVKNRFLRKELVEVEIVKVPRSISLNNYVRQTGKITGISEDGNMFWVYLEESRKIVKFPKQHLREIYRFNKISKVQIPIEEKQVFYVSEILEERELDSDREMDGYDDEDETLDELFEDE